VESKRRIAHYVSSERAGKEADHGEAGNRRLDVRIACEIMGYRWREWNHALLRGGPFDAPGRFLSTADGPLSHLQVAASADAPPSAWPLLEVPRFTSRIQDAWAAAARAGLFDGAGMGLVHLEDGDWEVHRNGGARLARADSACFALALAALRWSMSARGIDGAGAAEALP
jgi:hypothetical protein